MTIGTLSEGCLFVQVQPEPEMVTQLKELNESVSGRCDFDVVIDLSMAEMITSASISNLLILQQWLQGSGHRLILCGVRVPTKCIFKTVGLDECFCFAKDKFSAMAALKPGEEPSEDVSRPQ